MDLNSVTLVGTLTDTPEAQEVGDTSVCDLELAVSERVKKDGEWRDVAMLVEVIVWGKQADACVEHLRGGSTIGVHGRLKHDGAGLRVIAQHVQFLSPVREVAAA